MSDTADDSVDTPRDAEALVKRLNEWQRRADQHQSGWRADAKRWYEFTSGDQWSADDRAAMMEEMRVPITFNRVDPMVSAVMGAEVLNRQAVQYYPREIGDAKASEMLGAAADWVRDNCDAEDEESDAFSDTIISGMGWTETTLSYETSAEGDVLVHRIDPLEMGWDPTAKKRNLVDARYVYRMRDYDPDEFKSKWPSKIDEVRGQQDKAIETGSDLHNNIAGDQYRATDGNPSSAATRPIRVIQMQWWDMEPAYAVQDPQSGQITDLTAEQVEQMAELYLTQGFVPPPAVKGKRRVYKQAIYAGSVLVEPTKKLDCGAFTFTCITGKRDRNRNTWYGVVKAMVDPQMWANKQLSQLLHIINTNSKGGLFYEQNAFVNARKAQDDWARPDSMIELQPGAIAGNRIKERTAPPLPQGIQSILEFAVESLPQVSGINLEMLGLVQREQAGVLEAQRKRSGYAILATFFDSLRRYRKMQGRVLLDYIVRYMSDGRLIRINGDRGIEYRPLVRQPGVVKYDIVVDEAPMSQNQKEAVWGMLVQMMPILKEMPIAPQVLAQMIEYSPLPSSLSAQIAKSINEPAPPDPMAQAQQQLAMAGAQADVAGKQANAALTAAKARREEMESNIRPIEAAGRIMGSPQNAA